MNKLIQNRFLYRCGVDDESSNSSISSPKISWPPTNPNSNWRQLRPVKVGNPLFGTKMQLYSKTKHNLAVYPDGGVRGTTDENDLHSRHFIQNLTNYISDYV